MAKATLGIYTKLPNYRNNWLRLGFSERDIDDSSDRFLDAMVAWGDIDTIVERIQAHWQAGADHVCVQPLGAENPALPETNVLEELAVKLL